MNDNNTLKELLSTKFELIKDYDSYFAEIAKELMCNYRIERGKDDVYDIVEIEFYLYTPKHRDVITYPRQMDGGRWFFHQSGVDITFDSNKSVFGGILIRGLRKNGIEYIGGPQKCVDELWHDFDAFNSTGYPLLKYHKGNFDSNKMWRGKRWIKIKDTDRIMRVKNWNTRVGLDENADVAQYIEDEFIIPTTHLYRYVYLSEEEIKKLKTSYAARPQLASLLQVCRNE